MSTTDSTSEHHGEGVKRRDFLFIAAGGFGAVGAAAAVWPLVDNLNPSADVLALSTVEVDISKVQVGQSIRVKWRGKPVFIRHRTEDEVAKAKAVSGDSNLLFRRNSQTGAIEISSRTGTWGGLNAALHSND